MIPAPTGAQPEDFRSHGALRPAILLLLHDHESHGYELISRLDQLGLNVTPTSGWLYRSLRTMFGDGLVTSYWSTPEQGPPRRVYAITEEGEQRLEASMAVLATLARTVCGMLNRYRSGC